MTDEITLSIVVPVYSGSAYLPDLVAEIEQLKSRWANAQVDLTLSEAILSLDAPVDDSRDLLRRLSANRPWIRQVELSRNFGQHAPRMPWPIEHQKYNRRCQ